MAQGHLPACHPVRLGVRRAHLFMSLEAVSQGSQVFAPGLTVASFPVRSRPPGPTSERSLIFSGDARLYLDVARFPCSVL